MNEAVEAAAKAYKNPGRMIPNTSDGAMMVRLEAALAAALPHLTEGLARKVRDTLGYNFATEIREDEMEVMQEVIDEELKRRIEQ